MAIVKELKNLGKKMTGSDLTGNTVSEALKAIEEKYTGGSPGTYETVADRLVVTLEKVPYEKDGQTYYEWQGDKTYTEIKAALSAKKSVEVLLPWDFDGVLKDPAMIHLYPCLPLDSVGSILFSSHVMTLEKRVFFEAKCVFDGEKPTVWDAVQRIVQSEFAFTSTPDGQGGFTVTPGDGVTYEAILNAVRSSPLVFAKISVPALNKTVIAQFSGIDSGSTGILTATVVEYFNGAYCIMALDVYEDGRMIATVQPIPTQS